VVVESQDPFGNASAVSAATGLSLARATGTGVLGGTSTGTIALGQSQVSIGGVTYTKAEPGVQISATRTSGNVLTAGTSAPFTVSSLADRLVITSINGGSNPTAGTAFSVTVQSQDSVGNAGNVAADTPILLSLNTGTVAGTLSGTITAGQSQVTISGVTYTKAESGVRLAATRTGGDNLIAAVSSPFTVDPGAATAFVVTGSATQTAGTPNQLTITAKDANGNVATGYTGDHSLTLTGAASIGANNPTVTDKTGAAVTFGSAATLTFTNGVSTAGASMVLYKAESPNVVATDGAITTTGGNRLAVTVSPASTSTFAVTDTAGPRQGLLWQHHSGLRRNGRLHLDRRSSRPACVLHLRSRHRHGGPHLLERRHAEDGRQPHHHRHRQHHAGHRSDDCRGDGECRCRHAPGRLEQRSPHADRGDSVRPDRGRQGSVQQRRSELRRHRRPHLERPQRRAPGLLPLPAGRPRHPHLLRGRHAEDRR
jgi:hypothetical protein